MLLGPSSKGPFALLYNELVLLFHTLRLKACFAAGVIVKLVLGRSSTTADTKASGRSPAMRALPLVALGSMRAGGADTCQAATVLARALSHRKPGVGFLFVLISVAKLTLGAVVAVVPLAQTAAQHIFRAMKVAPQGQAVTTGTEGQFRCVGRWAVAGAAPELLMTILARTKVLQIILCALATEYTAASSSTPTPLAVYLPAAKQ